MGRNRQVPCSWRCKNFQNSEFSSRPCQPNTGIYQKSWYKHLDIGTVLVPTLLDSFLKDSRPKGGERMVRLWREMRKNDVALRDEISTFWKLLGGLLAFALSMPHLCRTSCNGKLGEIKHYLTRSNSLRRKELGGKRHRHASVTFCRRRRTRCSHMSNTPTKVH